MAPEVQVGLIWFWTGLDLPWQSGSLSLAGVYGCTGGSGDGYTCGLLVCPGPQRRLLYSGLVWSGLIWSGLVWSELVWPGLVWSGLVWSGLVWSGLVWSGLVWSGLVWSANRNEVCAG